MPGDKSAALLLVATGFYTGTLSVSASCAPESEQSKAGIHYSSRSIMCLMNNGTCLDFSPFPASAGAAKFIRDVEIAGGQQPSEPVWLNRKYLGFSKVSRCENLCLCNQILKLIIFSVYNRLYLRDHKYLTT